MAQAIKNSVLSAARHFNELKQEQARGGEVPYSIFGAHVATDLFEKGVNALPKGLLKSVDLSKWVLGKTEEKQTQTLLDFVSLLVFSAGFTRLGKLPWFQEMKVGLISASALNRVHHYFIYFNRNKKKTYEIGELIPTARMQMAALRSLVLVGATYYLTKMQCERNTSMAFKTLFLFNASVTVLNEFGQDVIFQDVRKGFEKFVDKDKANALASMVLTLGAVYAAQQYIVPELTGQSVNVDWRWQAGSVAGSALVNYMLSETS